MQKSDALKKCQHYLCNYMRVACDYTYIFKFSYRIEYICHKRKWISWWVWGMRKNSFHSSGVEREFVSVNISTKQEKLQIKKIFARLTNILWWDLHFISWVYMFLWNLSWRQLWYRRLTATPSIQLILYSSIRII